MDVFKTVKRSKDTSIKYKLAIDLSKQENTLALSVADSDYETCSYIKKALSDRVEHGAFGYLGVPNGFRELIKDWFIRRYHVDIKKQHVVFTTKVLQGLSVVLNTLTNENDQVLIQTPVYHMFMPLVKDNNRTLVDSPLKQKDGKYVMDYDDLEEKFKQGVKAMVLCSPHNPVGRVYTYDELQKVISLAKQYDVIVISDEIHADLLIECDTFTTAAAFFKDYKNIIVVTAPSKTFNIAGLQTAHMITPNQKYLLNLKRTLHALHANSPNALALTALKAAYKQCDAWVEMQNRHIKENFLMLKEETKQWPKLKITPLEGTYLAWLDIGFTNLTSTEFVKQLAISKGLVLSDGIKFAPYETQYIRMNLACSKDQLKKALSRFNHFIKSLNL